jgi:hypothetical protein
LNAAVMAVLVIGARGSSGDRMVAGSIGGVPLSGVGGTYASIVDM